MWVRFWIKSNRGTDQEGYEWLPNVDENDETIKEALEDWCSQFGTWDQGDNVVNYGYEIVERPPHSALDPKLARVRAQIADLRTAESVIVSTIQQHELAQRTQVEWNRQEERLNDIIQAISLGHDEMGPNQYANWPPERKKSYVRNLMRSYATKRQLAEGFAQKGIEVSFNQEDDPKINSIWLNFSPEEWADLLNKEGELLPACCANISRIRDILGGSLRENGEIQTMYLWEAVQLIEGHNDCDAFPEDHPLRKLVALWKEIEEHADTRITGVFRNPNDPKDALDVVYACSGVVAWNHLVTPHMENREYEQRVAVNFALAQMWPAIKTLYHKLSEVGFPPVKGWAVCLGEEVLDSHAGFCIFQNKGQAIKVLNRVNVNAQGECERNKITRLNDIENGAYDEGGRYEGHPIPLIPEPQVYKLRWVQVSKEKGIEFLDEESVSD